jgi:ketosteroid isomerase-like protein
MRVPGRLRLPVAVVALLAACAERPSPGRAAALAAVLDSVMAEHARHFVAGDLDALVALYAESTEVRPAGMAPVRGREALRATLRAWLDAAPVKTLRYTTADFAPLGDSAFHIASYEGTFQPAGGPEVADRGSCALLWVWSAAAGWQVHRSLCNSSLAREPQ